MNIIETIKKLLSEDTELDAFNGGIHVDYTEPAINGKAGLFSSGATKIGEDLWGNPKYRINFTLYTGMRGFTDYDRQLNETALLQLTYYMDGKKEKRISETVCGKEYSGEITGIRSSNAMAYDVPTGDINDGVRYQMQFAVDYIIYTEGE